MSSLGGVADRPWKHDWSAALLSDVDLDAGLDPRPWVVDEGPELDGHGRLIYGDHWVGLSLVEERLAERLVQRRGAVVRQGELLRCGWPGAMATRNSLRIAIGRLRARLAPLGLEIVTLHRVGYMLQVRRP